MKKIIIIGSSDIVLEKKLGKKIDKFDVIVRFNRAPTKNYELNVGSKTTYRFVNSHVVHNAQKSGEDLNFLPNLKNQIIVSDKDIKEKDFHKIFDKSCSYQQVNRWKCFELFKTNTLNSMDFEHKNELVKEPSIGLTGIMHFINENYKPTIYGFHIHDENKNVAPHYWKPKPKVGGIHDFTLERRLITKLIDLKYVNLLK